ncbi:MAG TPA: Fic family protein [Gallicola sp.]|nr:Fic family protein [Gallicola sp.]
MDKYIPPFEISNEMLKKVSDIMEKIGKLDSFTNLDKTPYLRKQTKINSVHSSVAIENNPLSLEQVKDVINGKLVIGEQKDIQEVKNAYKAYEMLKDINPYSIDDLKKVHGVMTFLVEEVSGEFRTTSEGVFDDNGNCIFVCPPGDRVNSLMNDLFEWLNENKDTIHPLILSSIFHYEFVFIHPFTNGNGRTVRLWQNSILYKWKDIFEYLPIESKIHKYQDEYYDSIAKCHKSANSNVFIEFMLKMIDETLDEAISTSHLPITNETININKLLDVMESGKPMTATEIMEKLGIKSKETLRGQYLDPAIKQGLVSLTIPDKPTSKNQMYYKK